jgi:hypothetical protein
MTTWEPQIAARAVRPVVAALELLGYDVDAILPEDVDLA